MKQLRFHLVTLDPDPTHIIWAYLEIIKKKRKFNQKEESTNYLPFSISYYNPTVHTVQNSQAKN